MDQLSIRLNTNLKYQTYIRHEKYSLTNEKKYQAFPLLTYIIQKIIAYLFAIEF